MRMEVSQYYLATESFSYSWLPTLDHLQPHQPKPSINPSTLLFPQQEPNSTSNTNFDFDISNYSSNSSLVHADKLFSNGRLIVPPSPSSSSSLNHAYSRARREKISYRVTSPGSVALFPSPSNYPSSSTHHNSAGKYNYLKAIIHNLNPRRVLSKYIRCLIPAGSATSRGRNGIRVDDVNRRAWEVQNCNSSLSTPCRTEIDESSIYEAIVYCKRSSGSSD